jgi:hypothetical protein
MKRRAFTIALGIFFVTLFLIGGIINIIEADYLPAIGFLLLSGSNIPPLIGSFQQRPPTQRESIATNIMAFSGLILVVMSWVGSF